MLAAFLFLLSCSQGLDKNKFSDVDRSAKAVKAAVGQDRQFGEELQRFSDRVAALRGAVKSAREKELLDAYEFLLSIYRDGALLMKYRNEFTRYGFVSPGMIYVGQDVEPIVRKYRLQTESHVYGPTGQRWKSIPEDSIKIIWINADSQLARINFLLNE